MDTEGNVGLKMNFSQLFLLGGIRKIDGVFHSMVSKD